MVRRRVLVNVSVEWRTADPSLSVRILLRLRLPGDTEGGLIIDDGREGEGGVVMEGRRGS